jgi:glycosyltransferase involved in cell wall biosynthesis
MLGGVSPPKGTLTFVRALPTVRAAQPDVRFLVAGPLPRTSVGGGARGLAKRLLGVGAYQRSVMRALSEADVGDSLIFTGVRQDIPQVLAASDVLVFPSTVPHFARPVIEAAAMGKPAIASDVGGPAELVVNGETGLLVPPKDAHALAEAIVELPAPHWPCMAMCWTRSRTPHVNPVANKDAPDRGVIYITGCKPIYLSEEPTPQDRLSENHQRPE